MQEQPLQTDIKSYAFYQHIVDLPLNRFIETATTGNLSALVISGEPPIEELQQAWGVIMSEYSMAIGDHETQLRFNLFTEIHKLEMKIKQLALIVSILQNYYVPRFVTELNRLLITTIVFDVHNKEDYDRKLKTALNKSKAFKIQLDLKVKHYESMQTNEEGGSVTKEYFQSVLITISNHAKYLIPDTITVYQFCERIKRFNKEMEIKK